MGEKLQIRPKVRRRRLHHRRMRSPSDDELHHDPVGHHDAHHLLQDAVSDAGGQERDRHPFTRPPARSHYEMATRRGVLVRSHAGRGQVCVLVLQFAVQSDAPPLPVIGQQGEQLVDLLKGRAGRHRVPETKRHTETIGAFD